MSIESSNQSVGTAWEESLRRCSPATLTAARRFQENGDRQAVPTVVYGILERYQPSTAPVRLAAARDDTRLVEDLGLDSLTLLEIVLTLEEVLTIRIENEELRSIRTVANLNQFIHDKIAGVSPVITATHFTREQITLVLPQQPPFLFLDHADLHADLVTATYRIRGDEYFLEGHFKGDPVFPASIVFEALGQSACLWVVEKAPAQLGKPLTSNQVLFASLDGAHFFRKARPGDTLQIEQKLIRLRDPLAIFSGTVTVGGQPVAKVERLVLAFGDLPLPETPPPAA